MENQVRMTKLSKTLSIVLGLTILGAIAALIYVIAVPASGDTFTEFYILGPGGKAADYPTQLKVGEEGLLNLAVVNWEHETMSYRIDIIIEGVTSDTVEPIILQHGEKFERGVSFTPNETGDEQMVEFLLFKQGQGEVYRSLHLIVNVEKRD